MTLDPLDVSQWRFFVLPTFIISERLTTQKNLGLSTLKRLGAAETCFEELKSAIKEATFKQREMTMRIVLTIQQNQIACI